jgi:hypothetical protein
MEQPRTEKTNNTEDNDLTRLIKILPPLELINGCDSIAVGTIRAIVSVDQLSGKCRSGIERCQSFPDGIFCEVGGAFQVELLHDISSVRFYRFNA